jgi:hypothetical protein
MNFAERVQRAAVLARNPEAYIHCKLRGEIVGERLCRTCGEDTTRPVRTCPHHPEGVVIVMECRRCDLVEPDETKRVVAITDDEADISDAESSELPWNYNMTVTGKEKRFVIPDCPYRGEIRDRREKGCCGGLTRIDELFACAHPENGFGEAWSVTCANCALMEKAPSADSKKNAGVKA